MDPAIQTLGLQLADTAARNSAGFVLDRVAAIRAAKKSNEAVIELEEIINGLIADKTELVGIAQAFEQELVAQRIQPDDFTYITNTLVPVLEQLLSSQQAAGTQDGSSRQAVEMLKPLLSVQTLTVLQLIGFNIRKGIGEPLTELASRAIMSKAATDPLAAAEMQRLVVEQNIAYLQVAQDEAAFARLQKITGAAD